VTWAWLGPPSLDFGTRDRAGVDREHTVWLYADPYRALGVPPSADRAEVQRAYRRVAGQHHPDVNPGDAAAAERFHQVRQAFEAVVGEPEVTVEPVAGAWWRFTGFSAASPPEDPSAAVAGLRFELHDRRRVPLRDAADDVRISYAGQTLSLRVGYSRSRIALPLWRARIGAAAEASLLLLLCLTSVPVAAVLLAADVYLLSDRNVLLTWAGALLILGLGYGALAAILTSCGRRVPYPRRVVGRARGVVGELNALRTRHG
jgi:hypothetical protein